MPDEIKPALGADDWKGRGYDLREAGYAFRVLVERGGLAVEAWAGDDEETDYTETAFVPAATLPAVMALANAAFPDDHPGKLTRADVRLLEYQGRHLWPLAAKLDALLPPEEG